MIVQNSKKVQVGDTFVWISDTREHLEEAIQNGAYKIIGPKLDKNLSNVEYVATDNPRLYLAQELRRYYKNTQPKYCYAVTGTNGKSSTVYYLHQLWNCMKLPNAVLGTLGLHSNIDYQMQDLNNTTVDPCLFHEILSILHNRQVDYFACEASSHGLDQYRLDGCDFHGVAFTNLSQDHLDYHTSMETYFQAKYRLFKDFKTDIKVINANDPYGRHILENIPSCRSYGPSTGFWYDEHSLYLGKHVVPLKNLKIIGSFQYENLLCACLLLYDFIEKFIHHLPNLMPPPGRMQKVYDNPLVVVDYAHTPDAMACALQTLRPLGDKLIVVFGCGGNRDRSKREIMGNIASQFCDCVVVTDDNPRFEDPKLIRQDITKGCDSNKVIEISCRAEAIHHALSIAGKNDCVAILGKGHEKTQIIENKIIPFDDVSMALSFFVGK